MHYNYKICKKDAHGNKAEIKKFITSEDISIYVDVWCSLNGRFQQRMYDPTYDLLKANWSPFKKVEYLLPLLTEYSDFRERMFAIEKEIYEWSNVTEVLFVADFPGKQKKNNPKCKFIYLHRKIVCIITRFRFRIRELHNGR